MEAARQRSADQEVTADPSTWLVSERVQEALADLDDRVQDALVVADIQLRAMAISLVHRKSKRIRPALLMLAAEFGEFDRERLRSAAVALELLHLASLYHDDVMDRAPLRRHGPSVNAEWGNRAAVVAGAFLVARATALFAPLGAAHNRQIGSALVRLCTGQLDEAQNAYNTELTEAEHLDIVARKTATFFELPCALGTSLAAVPDEAAAALRSYGRDLGIAFQITDDALDLRGTAVAMGKQPLTDVRDGTYTLSLLRLIARPGAAAGRIRALLQLAHPGESDAAEIASVVLTSGTIEDALGDARIWGRRARAHLDVLPHGPSRRSLDRLVDFAVDRMA